MKCVSQYWRDSGREGRKSGSTKEEEHWQGKRQNVSVCRLSDSVNEESQAPRWKVNEPH